MTLQSSNLKTTSLSSGLAAIATGVPIGFLLVALFSASEHKPWARSSALDRAAVESGRRLLA
jgi:hypothetical protein